MSLLYMYVGRETDREWERERDLWERELGDWKRERMRKRERERVRDIHIHADVFQGARAQVTEQNRTWVSSSDHSQAEASLHLLLQLNNQNLLQKWQTDHNDDCYLVYYGWFKKFHSNVLQLFFFFLLFDRKLRFCPFQFPTDRFSRTRVDIC